MPNLVDELVEMASSPTVGVSELLRRALVAARRLDVPELVAWISSELNGYSSSDVPDYRVISGSLKAFNPYRGPIPLMLPDAESARRFSVVCVRQSVSELAELSRGTTGVTSNFSPELEYQLREQMDIDLRPFISLSTVQVPGIVEKVRPRILEWALDLESRGVVGKGLSFTPEEKQTVQQQHYHFGDVTGSQIQIGVTGSNQTKAEQAQQPDLQHIGALVEALSEALAGACLSAAVEGELQAELATLKAQIASPKPKWPIIRSAAQTFKTVAEGAAGGLLAELAKPHAQTLLSLIGKAITGP